MAIDQLNPSRCGLSWAAKVIASGVFITGRDPREILSLSCAWMAAPDALMKEVLETRDPSLLLSLPVEIDVDNQTKTVGLRLDGEQAWARYVGDQGCVVLDAADGEIHFTPQSVARSPATDDFEPTADPVVDASGATGLNAQAVNAALDFAFADPKHFTNACVVVHKGKIIAERYRDPYDPSTQFESWSMGKSIASTMVGVLERDGAIDLDEDELFDTWRSDKDARRNIRVRNILNMASGLEFTGSYGKDEDHSVKSENGRFLDHIYVYASGVNSVEFCVSKPLADPPGKAGRYRNCDPLLATALVRDRGAKGDIQDFLGWPQRKLYDRIGSGGMVLETDPYGNFLISGHDYGRARDWARLGQLYLQRGAWGGDQILNESFVEFVQTPAEEAWRHDPYYGGFFCTNATGILSKAPKDTYWMSGGGIQRTYIIPSKDLVIMRMGHMAGAVFGAADMCNELIGMLCEA
ncbi:MAG: serine hydrolase [Pseudomonadota bacterium]